MGFLGDLVAGAAAGTIKGTFEGIGSLARDIRAAVTGEVDPEKKAELLMKIAELESLANRGQMDVNIAEASNKSVFVSGWRPSVGWVCSISLAAYFIPQYLLASVLWVKLSWTAQALAAFPIAEPHGLLELVLGMLGLGAMRTLEKMGGSASK